MSKVNIHEIQKIARWVDRTENGGNHDNTVDGSEVSIFVEKLKGLGVSNPQNIIDEYNNNKMEKEAQYDYHNVTADSSVEAAIAGALNKDSFVNKNKVSAKNVKGIISNIKDAVNNNGWFFGLGTDDKKLSDSVRSINKDNIMNILSADKNIVNSIVGDVSDDDINTYGEIIINSLVKAAQDRQIDISGIVVVSEKSQPKYSVGRNVSGLKFGDSVTTEDNLNKIVMALYNAINKGKKNAVNPNAKQKKDTQSLLNDFANKADSTSNNGNGNGFVDGEEVAEFKRLAAGAGIDVNEMLNSIREKTDKKQTLNEKENFLKLIFTTKDRTTKSTNSNTAKDAAKGVQVGIEDEDSDKIGRYLQTVDKTTIMQFLAEMDKAGYKNTIGEKIYDVAHGFFTGDDSKPLVAKIINDLVDYANYKEIDVSDIVTRQSNDGSFYMPNGESALEHENSDKVITALRARINDELNVK